MQRIDGAGVESLYAPPNNPLQRSMNDKVLGRGRDAQLLKQVCGARVLNGRRAAAERGR